MHPFRDEGAARSLRIESLEQELARLAEIADARERALAETRRAFGLPRPQLWRAGWLGALALGLLGLGGLVALGVASMLPSPDPVADKGRFDAWSRGMDLAARRGPGWRLASVRVRWPTPEGLVDLAQPGSAVRFELVHGERREVETVGGDFGTSPPEHVPDQSVGWAAPECSLEDALTAARLHRTVIAEYRATGAEGGWRLDGVRLDASCRLVHPLPVCPPRRGSVRFPVPWRCSPAG